MLAHDVHHHRPSGDLGRFSSATSSSSSSSSSSHHTDPTTPSSSTATTTDDRPHRRRPSGHGAASSFGRSSTGEGSSSRQGSAFSAGGGGGGAPSSRPPSFQPSLMSSSRPASHLHTSSWDASFSRSSASSSSGPGEGSSTPFVAAASQDCHSQQQQRRHTSRSPPNPRRASAAPSSHSSTAGQEPLPSSPSAPSSTSSTSTARPPSPAASSRTATSVSAMEAARNTSTTPDIPPPSFLTHPPNAEPPAAHLDLAAYPPEDLVRLLAALLQQIATANDVLRKEEGETAERSEGREDAHDASSSSRVQQQEPASGARDGSDEMEGQEETEERPMSRPPSLESTSSVLSNQSDAPPRTPSDTVDSVPVASTPRTSFDAASPHAAAFVSSSSSAGPSTATPIAAAGGGVVRASTPTSTPAATPGAGGLPPTTAPKHLTASLSAFKSESSSLCFHARNIPGINIEVYLQRILRYCPASNEVFLSLLVYFDRMSKLSTELGGKPFAIDSFNVHRLVIAGVTVASKFFSDVFYTNSRYAKVGGLPQSELNQLELQFLLLNDFNLAIPLDEMQRYGDQLLLYSQNAAAE